MSETKYTAGAWKVDIWEYSLSNSGVNPPAKELAIINEENRIAVLDWDQGKENPFTIPNDEALANARLIAASPELLEACKTALDRVNGLIRDIPSQAGIFDIWAKELRATIAKAEGGE